MKKTFAILAAIAAFEVTIYAASTQWGTDIVGFVQYASDNSVSARRDAAQPGVILATELRDSGNNQVAALTIGSPDATRIRVIDRYALHKTPLEKVEFPNYYIELGEGTALLSTKSVKAFDRFVVPGTGQQPDLVTYAHTFRIVPLGGVRITKAVLSKANADAGSGAFMPSARCTVEADYMDDGSVVVKASISSFQDTYTYSIDIVIDQLYGSPTLENETRDDLTMSDYFFKDEYGNTSLGKLRDWVHRTYDKFKADRWSDYAAAGTVNLSANRVRFSRSADLRTESVVVPDDSITIRQNGKIMLRSVGAANSTNGTFRIIGMDLNIDPLYDCIYTDTSVTEPPYVLTCTSLVEGNWERPNGQVTQLSTYEGQPAYVISVPKSNDARKFFKAVAAGDETSAYLYTEAIVFASAGIALQDSSGGWWMVKVDTSGNLSTEAISEVPKGLPQ